MQYARKRQRVNSNPSCSKHASTASEPGSENNHDTSFHRPGIFRLLELPLELREEIYEQCAGPLPALDTAAIKNHGSIHIPVIAQLCRQIRQEALAVLFRGRELKFSLHCDRNLQRGEQWLRAAGPEEDMPNHITFAGVLRQTSEFFQLTVRCSPKGPQQFMVQHRVGEAVGKKTVAISQELQETVKKYLEAVASEEADGTKAGKLQGTEVLHMLEIVKSKAHDR